MSFKILQFQLIPILIISLLSGSCSVSRPNTIVHDAVDTIASPLKFSYHKVSLSPLKSESFILKFMLENASESTVGLYNPYQLIIFKTDELNQYLPIRDCPCNAPCPPRPSSIELTPGQNFELIWDMFLTNCSPSQDGNDSISDRIKVPKGDYVIRMQARLEGENDYRNFDYPFTIE